MKVLVTASGDIFSSYGGGQTYVLRLVEALSRQTGVKICALSFVAGGQGKKIAEICQGRVPVYEVDPSIKPSQMAQFLCGLRPDVIHANGGKALMCRAARMIGIPCVVTAHHGGILCPAGALLNANDAICHVAVTCRHCLKCCLKNIRFGLMAYPILRWLPRSFCLAVGRLLMKLPFICYVTPVGCTVLHIETKMREWQTICQECSAMVAPSMAIRESMLLNGMPSEKMVVLPHGVPKPVTIPPFAPPNDGKVKFFCVGRVSYVKGLHVLLAAFRKANAPLAELHIIGGAGNKREQAYMERLQKRYADDRRVFWHGKVSADKAGEMIAECHVLVHPAICMEIFGLDMAEALSMGKWILATRCGGAEMQISEGENGWLVPPNDIFALSKKMEDIVSRPPVSSPAILNCHTMEEHVSLLQDVLEKSIGEVKFDV